MKDSSLNAVVECDTNEATKIAIALIEQTYIVKGSIKDVETLCECKKKVDYYLGLACTSPEDLEAEYRSMYDELFENVSYMLRLRTNLALKIDELGCVTESFDFEDGTVRFIKNSIQPFDDDNYTFDDDNYKYVAFITADETEIFPLEGSPYVIANEIVKILYFA